MPTHIRHFFVDAANRPLWFEDFPPNTILPSGQIVIDKDTGDTYTTQSISSTPSGDKIVVVRKV